MAMLEEEELKDAALIVFANKQDLAGAMTAVEITESLQLHGIKDHGWQIQACSATTGEGLYEGLDLATRTTECKSKGVVQRPHEIREEGGAIYVRLSTGAAGAEHGAMKSDVYALVPPGDSIYGAGNPHAPKAKRSGSGRPVHRFALGAWGLPAP